MTRLNHSRNGRAVSQSSCTASRSRRRRVRFRFLRTLADMGLTFRFPPCQWASLPRRPRDPADVKRCSLEQRSMFLNYILKEGVFTHVRTKISIWRGRFSPLWMSCGSGLQVIGLPSEEGRTMPQSLPLRPSAALVSSGTGEGCWGAPEGDAGKGCWEGHGGHQPALRRGWLTGCLVLLELREEEQRSASSLGDGVCLPSLGCSKQAESGRDSEMCVAGSQSSTTARPWWWPSCFEQASQVPIFYLFQKPPAAVCWSELCPPFWLLSCRKRQRPDGQK